MIIDGHAHLFTPRVIANVSARTALGELLDLETRSAAGRTGAASLAEECRRSGVDACLVLPTAAAAEVQRVNGAFRDMAAGTGTLIPAGTLHPSYPANREELRALQSVGTRAIKLCSFSQGFSLEDPETSQLFSLIEECNASGRGFFVVIDTFYRAHEFFGTPRHHTTTPALLGETIRRFQGIPFVAAHMGGLTAPPEEIFAHLLPSDNLYLDTSNAAHTLPEKEFLGLLDLHGPTRIIFGTDWPWFGHPGEIELIGSLMDRAGFTAKEQEEVWHRNIAGLLGMMS